MPEIGFPLFDVSLLAANPHHERSGSNAAGRDTGAAHPRLGAGWHSGAALRFGCQTPPKAATGDPMQHQQAIATQLPHGCRCRRPERARRWLGRAASDGPQPARRA